MELCEDVKEDEVSGNATLAVADAIAAKFCATIAKGEELGRAKAQERETG